MIGATVSLECSVFGTVVHINANPICVEKIKKSLENGKMIQAARWETCKNHTPLVIRTNCDNITTQGNAYFSKNCNNETVINTARHNLDKSTGGHDRIDVISIVIKDEHLINAKIKDNMLYDCTSEEYNPNQNPWMGKIFQLVAHEGTTNVIVCCVIGAKRDAIICAAPVGNYAGMSGAALIDDKGVIHGSLIQTMSSNENSLCMLLFTKKEALINCTFATKIGTLCNRTTNISTNDMLNTTEIDALLSAEVKVHIATNKGMYQNSKDVLKMYLMETYITQLLIITPFSSAMDTLYENMCDIAMVKWNEQYEPPTMDVEPIIAITTLKYLWLLLKAGNFMDQNWTFIYINVDETPTYVALRDWHDGANAAMLNINTNRNNSHVNCIMKCDTYISNKTSLEENTYEEMIIAGNQEKKVSWRRAQASPEVIKLWVDDFGYVMFNIGKNPTTSSFIISPPLITLTGSNTDILTKKTRSLAHSQYKLGTGPPNGVITDNVVTRLTVATDYGFSVLPLFSLNTENQHTTSNMTDVRDDELGYDIFDSSGENHNVTSVKLTDGYGYWYMYHLSKLTSCVAKLGLMIMGSSAPGRILDTSKEEYSRTNPKAIHYGISKWNEIKRFFLKSLTTIKTLLFTSNDVRESEPKRTFVDAANHNCRQDVVGKNQGEYSIESNTNANINHNIRENGNLVKVNQYWLAWTYLFHAIRNVKVNAIITPDCDKTAKRTADTHETERSPEILRSTIMSSANENNTIIMKLKSWMKRINRFLGVVAHLGPAIYFLSVCSYANSVPMLLIAIINISLKLHTLGNAKDFTTFLEKEIFDYICLGTLTSVWRSKLMFKGKSIKDYKLDAFLNCIIPSRSCKINRITLAYGVWGASITCASWLYNHMMGNAMITFFEAKYSTKDKSANKYRSSRSNMWYTTSSLVICGSAAISIIMMWADRNAKIAMIIGSGFDLETVIRKYDIANMVATIATIFVVIILLAATYSLGLFMVVIVTTLIMVGVTVDMAHGAKIASSIVFMLAVAITAPNMIISLVGLLSAVLIGLLKDQTPALLLMLPLLTSKHEKSDTNTFCITKNRRVTILLKVAHVVGVRIAKIISKRGYDEHAWGAIYPKYIYDFSTMKGFPVKPDSQYDVHNINGENLEGNRTDQCRMCKHVVWCEPGNCVTCDNIREFRTVDTTDGIYDRIIKKRYHPPFIPTDYEYAMRSVAFIALAYIGLTKESDPPPYTNKTILKSLTILNNKATLGDFKNWTHLNEKADKEYVHLLVGPTAFCTAIGDRNKLTDYTIMIKTNELLRSDDPTDRKSVV